MDKLEMKAKRQEILKEIDVLEKQRCEKCSVSTLNTAMVHCGCRAAVEIRKLGTQYEAIAKEARMGRVHVVVAKVKNEGLTVEGYQELREFNLTDLQIIKLIGTNKSAFINWKAEMKLNGYKAEVLESTEKVEKPKLYEKHGLTELDMRLAKRNGLDYQTVIKRVQKGWTTHKAVTKPLQKRRTKEEMQSV